MPVLLLKPDIFLLLPHLPIAPSCHWCASSSFPHASTGTHMSQADKENIPSAPQPSPPPSNKARLPCPQKTPKAQAPKAPLPKVPRSKPSGAGVQGPGSKTPRPLAKAPRSKTPNPGREAKGRNLSGMTPGKSGTPARKRRATMAPWQG